MALRVPGDKSITQRALLLAALADGESRLSGLLTADDPRSLAGVLRSLGAAVPPLPPDGGEIRFHGSGLRGLARPDAPLDCGNSGTAARLLLGVLSAQPFTSELTGDASLRGRPMRRVTDPLGRMGARFEEAGEEGRLPLRVRGGDLRPLRYDLPVASAQVKSALLLAGTCGTVPVALTEPLRSRDHTERMLARMGCRLTQNPSDEGRWGVSLPDPPAALRPLDLRVPGDVSSAAYLAVLALLGGAGGELTIEDVGLNPTRTGLLPVLERMGARIRVEAEAGEPEGEPRGALTAAPAELHGVEVGAEEIPGMIDEVPALVVAAARARGTTTITGAAELRVKESDRLSALAENLRAVGAEVRELEDGLVIEGSQEPLRGRVRCRGDHRIAMAFGVLGSLEGNRIEVDEPRCVEVSFPGFWNTLREATSRRRPAPGTGRGA